MKRKSTLLVLMLVLVLVLVLATACEHDHTWGDWTLTKAPTATEKGSASRPCSECDETDVAEVPVLTDTSVWTYSVKTAATHTTAGKGLYTSIYGQVEVDLPAGEGNHSYVWTIKTNPTASNKGSAEGVCACGDKSTVELAELTNASVWTLDQAASVAASCKADGTEVYKSIYGNVEVVISKSTVSHTYGAWVLDQQHLPTLSAEGKASHVCSVCQNSEEGNVPNLQSPIWTKVASECQAPTCSAEGSDVYLSTDYGKVSVSVAVDASAHNYGSLNAAVAATCSEAGSIAYYQCSLCQKYFNESKVEVQQSALATSIDANAHSYGAWELTQNPTASEYGTAVRVCEHNDQHVDTDSQVAKLSDTSVWTSSVKSQASYNAPEISAYTSIYGSIEYASAPKLVAPYDSKSYFAVEIDVSKANNDGSIDAEQASATVACMVVNANGVGTSEIAPFRGKWVITMVNPATGEVSIAVYDKKSSSSGPIGPGGWGDYDPDDDNDYEYYSLLAASNEDDEDPYQSTPSKTIHGYVDMATGIMVLDIYNTNWVRIFVAAPATENLDLDSFTAGVAEVGDKKVVAISYALSEGSLDMVEIGGEVSFGAQYLAWNGEDAFALDSIDADEIATAPLVHIHDAQNNVIIAYATNTLEGFNYVETDGLEGVYSIAQGDSDSVISADIAILGSGLIEVVPALNEEVSVMGQYVSVSQSPVVIGATLYDSVNHTVVYYEITLSGDALSANGGVHSNVKPMVSITYDLGGVVAQNASAVAPASVNKAIAIALPVPTNETKLFTGWYTDALCTQQVALDKDGNYVPSANVTLYAAWSDKALLTISGGVVGSDSATIYVGVGDVYGDILPAYEVGVTIDEVNNKYFGGWFIDEALTQALNVQLTVTEAEISGVTIYAKWIAIPAYAGTYYGKNTYNAQYLYEGESIIISPVGAISGNFTGNVVSYDAATQLLTWEDNDNVTRYFVFDAVSGILATGNSSSKCSNPLDSDMNVYSSENPTATRGWQLGASTFNVRLVDVVNKCGTSTILFYNNKIYANVVVKNAEGSVYTAANAGDEKTVVVTDASSGDIILAAASETGVKFSSNSKIKLLDSYFGSYLVVNSGDLNNFTATLDGAGAISISGQISATETVTLSGTYAKVADQEVFEIYIKQDNKNVAYYLVSNVNMEDREVEVSKPVASISFVVGEGHDAVESISANIKVENALPVPENTATKVFRGWLLSGSEDAIYSITPANTDAIVLTAVWEDKISINLVGTIGADPAVLDVVEGDVISQKLTFYTAGQPNADSSKYFVGWYTDAEYTTALAADREVVAADNGISLYALWKNSVPYAGTYYGWNLCYEKSGEKTPENLGTTNYVTINPDGSYKAYGLGMTGTGQIADEYHAVTDGAIKIGSRYVYVNVEIGALWYNYNSNTAAETSVGTDTYFLTKTVGLVSYEYYGNVTSTYGMSGKYVFWAIFHFEGDNDVNVVGYNDKIYANVSWTGITDVKQANKVDNIVTASDGTTEIFALLGGKIGTRDGYQGTYTLAENDNVVLNGMGGITIGSLSGTYTVDSTDENLLIVYLSNNSIYREITIDKSAHTYTSVQPTATVVYNVDGGEAITNASANINVDYTLAASATKSGYVFRGWYANAELTGSAITKVKPTEANGTVNVYAKWDKLVTITYNYQDGSTPATNVTTYAYNDKVTSIQSIGSAAVEGKVFAGWFTKDGTDDDWGNEFVANTVITSAMAVSDVINIYAKWVTPHALMGIYKGVELDSGTFRTYVSTYTIDAFGKMTGGKSGTIEETSTPNVYKLVSSSTSTFRLVYDPISQTIAISYSSSNPTTLGSDTYVAVKVASADVSVSIPSTTNYLTWDSHKNRLATYKVNNVDYNVLVYNDQVYGGVIIDAHDANNNPVTTVAGLKVNGVVFTLKDSANNVIASFGYVNGAVANSDGTAGSYTGSYGTIVSSGFGTLTLGDASAVDYSKDGSDLKFASGNRMYVVTLGEGTYTAKLDGYQGTYTLPDEGGSITLDGYGTAGSGKTYVVVGSNITIYDGASSIAYGIDSANHAFLGKSVMAGKVFSGKVKTEWDDSITMEIRFDDAASLSGTISLGDTLDFTAVITGDTIVFTITKTLYNDAQIGKTYTFTISDGKLVYVSRTVDRNTLNVLNGTLNEK